MTLRTACIAAAFCSVAIALYVLASAEPSPLVFLFVTYAPLTAVIVWMHKDAHRTGVGAVHDLGLFLWLAWPVVLPWYVFKTQGPSGWRLLGRLLGLITAPLLTFFLASIAAGILFRCSDN